MSRFSSSSRRAVLAAALLAAIGAPCSATAQSYPSQPIRLVVPFGAGGGVDIVARAIGNEWMKQFPHNIVVENRTGAGGNIGSAAAATSRPDGHTLLVASNSNSYNDFLYSNAGYDPAKDLMPIVQIGAVPIMLVSTTTVPENSVTEMVATAKAKPGTLNFASFGPGSSGHLLFEMFKRQAGIEIVHVPYRNGQTYPDIIAGRTHYIFANQLEATQYIKANQLKAIGVVGAQRLAAFPDVKSFAEQGLPDLRAEVWWGIAAPSGTPAPIAAQLNDILNKVLASQDVRDRLQSVGARPVGGSQQQFATFFAAERAKWQAVIRDAQIKLD